MYKHTKGSRYADRLAYQILGEEKPKLKILKRKNWTIYASNNKAKPFMSQAVLFARLNKKRK